MIAPVRALLGRMPRTVGCLAVFFLLVLAATGVALACVGPAEPTTLTTSLSGESKSGGSITVLEGSKVKDQATLGGKNAGKATGKISYAVYKDSSCKELVTKAGEFEFKEGKVPASEEKTLEGGKVYYWQAHYGGDSLDAESTSSCGSEVLTVKAATSLSTSLAGEAKSGEAITVLEGSGVKDKATLGGTNSSSATGTVEYKVYKDSECKELATSAGSAGVSGGSVAESESKTLEGGHVYYWRASYGGDSLHQASTGTCGKEVLTVRAATALSTSLSGEEKSGETITVLEGAKVKDKVTLTGTNVASATGKVTYAAYKDSECKELAAEAGEVTVSTGSVPASEEKTLEAGRTYYWRASYGGDSLHQASVGACGEEVEKVKAATTLSTALSGEGKSGEAITVLEGAEAQDEATLSGTHSSTATGKVEFRVYADSECEEFVAGAGEGSLSGAAAESEEVELEGGAVYYWQAEYPGDSLHQASTSTCGKEVLKVKAATSISTSLSGEGKSGEEITVLEGSRIGDQATLSGTKSGTATGEVAFDVYEDPECEELATAAGAGIVSGDSAESEEAELEAGAVYYWQAHYEGDALHQASTSPCTEKATVKAKTSLSTSLSGEGKSGEAITVLEGAEAQDEATLSGTHSSTATGKVDFNVYEDSGCEELATGAGEGSVSGGGAESGAVELEGGAVYYWQAHYEGDALHQASTSPCTEKATVKAKTSIGTSLAGEGKEGEAITVLEGSKVSDEATLSGPNSSTATGKVEFEVYKDGECKELEAGAGDDSAAGGSAESEGVELEAGAVYYWQAHYEGDALHEASTSPCTEESTVKAKISLATTLIGGGQEGAEITVANYPVADSATLSGTRASTATGTVNYVVYADPKCEELVEEAGEGNVEEGEALDSEELELEAGSAYYWQAEYGGDSLHQASISPCSNEVLTVKAATSIATVLAGEGKEGEIGEEGEGVQSAITVAEGASVKDTATLSGKGASEASGTVEYLVYGDLECEELVAEAGKVSAKGPSVPSSSAVTLEPGTYYWRTIYSGDGLNYPVEGTCGSEIEVVMPPITTSLSAGEASGAEVEAVEGTPVTDEATLHGEHASEASGTVEYFVYADPKCEELVEEAGEVKVEGEHVPASEGVELKQGTYYWQAEYSDGESPSVKSDCGSEVVVVTTPTSMTTKLSGGGEEGAEIEIEEGESVEDQAMLSGVNASTAQGEVEYAAYSDSECTELAMAVDAAEVSEGKVEASEPLILPSGKYYWLDRYMGDGVNRSATESCGAETVTVTAPITTSLSAGEASGPELDVVEGTPVTDEATLHGEHASEASGTVEYFVYADPKCEELVEEAGEVKVEGEHVPASEEMELESGTYYVQAEYSNGESPPAKSACGSEVVHILNPATDIYASLGDSFAAGVGVGDNNPGEPKGTYYENTRWWALFPYFFPYIPHINGCHRSASGWSPLVAKAIYGGGVTAPNEVFKQEPPHFIFRACSGAETSNIWSEPPSPPPVGQWDEFINNGNKWLERPAQALWLTKNPAGRPGGNPNNAIKLVTITAGVNDLGLIEVVKSCLQGPWVKNAVYRPEGCLRTVVRRLLAGYEDIRDWLPQVLTGIAQRAPQAQIRIPLYPRGVNWVPPENIQLGWGFQLNNIIRGTQVWFEGMRRREVTLTAAQAVDWFLASLNQDLGRTVNAWRAAHNIDVRVIPATEESLNGHRLGDPKPWLNGLVFPPVETAHPRVCGQRAVALAVLKNIAGGVGSKPVAC